MYRKASRIKVRPAQKISTLQKTQGGIHTLPWSCSKQHISFEYRSNNFINYLNMHLIILVLTRSWHAKGHLCNRWPDHRGTWHRDRARSYFLISNFNCIDGIVI